MKAELSAWQAEKIGKLFDLFDTDCDGCLDENELLASLERLRVDTGWPETSRVFSHVTGKWKLFLRALFQDSPVLNRQRFLTFMARFLNKAGNNGTSSSDGRRPLEESAKLLVMLLDRDRDNRLVPEDLHIFFRALGQSEAEADQAFEHLDPEESGYLPLEDVEKHLQEFFLSEEPGATGDWLFGPLEE